MLARGARLRHGRAAAAFPSTNFLLSPSTAAQGGIPHTYSSLLERAGLWPALGISTFTHRAVTSRGVFAEAAVPGASDGLWRVRNLIM